ncbi:hypothetical protein DPMN_027798 [Dreissena polymorpha]|uniref:Uncharacterized protein n=1 Tax=Dreissena polymorpha TaxID=45954 RepID=A0A9D4LTI8_DREPO|nr:hypothetical protein DPMN_027798 [Dreissena polymorpha]
MYSRCPQERMRDAVLTVSPNKQYLSMTDPTTPADTEPVNNDNLVLYLYSRDK